LRQYATNIFYAEPTYNNRLPEGFEAELTTDDTELLVDDLLDLEIESTGAGGLQQGTSRRTTDLVRLYLQEIGRVDLLGRDEEVSEAQSPTPSADAITALWHGVHHG
jgi:RNA polymerase nonessential primary-like sigma factor